MQMNKLKVLDSERCVFFLCDLQEKFRSHIVSFDVIIKTANRMIGISDILSVPLIITEQYPQGLGKTVSELNIKSAKLIDEKTEFSMLSNKINCYLEDNKIENVILMGVEAHVCIYQTCIGLLSKGINVHLLVDGISCRNINDGVIAVKQLQAMGAILTTSESIIFQLIRNKNHAHFKDVQALVKEIIPPNELIKRL